MGKEPDIDYTLLQKRGILKKSEAKKLPFGFDKKGMIDFTSPSVDNSSQTASSSGNEGGFFGFLDNPPAANSGSQSQGYYSNDSASGNEVSALKIKLEDLEFKLERFLERIALVESKLLDFERKAG